MEKMRKIRGAFLTVLAMVLCASFVLSSCNKKEDNFEPTLEVSPATVTISPNGGSASIMVKSNTNWKILGLPIWMTASSASGQNNGVFSIDAKNNQSAVATNCEITVQTGDGALKRTITVIVESVMNLSHSALTFGANADKQTLRIESNRNWTISGTPEWLTVSQLTGSGSTDITIEAKENTVTSDRTCELTFTSDDGKVAVCAVRQSAVEVVKLYADPCINWGCSVSEIKRNMKNYELQQEDDYRIIYKGKHQEMQIQYDLERSRLMMSSVLLPMNSVTMADIDDKLGDKYDFYEENSEIRLYLSADRKTIVGITKDSDRSAYMVSYIEASRILSPKLFEEPFISWGTSRPDVMTQMANARYTIYEDDYLSDNYPLVYEGKYSEVLVRCLFHYYKCLDEIDYAFDASEVSLSTIREYVELTLNYNYLGYSSGSYLYTTSDRSSYVVLTSKRGENGFTVITLGYVNPDVVSAKTRGADGIPDLSEFTKFKVNTKDIEAQRKNRIERVMKIISSGLEK